jgi:hypothetical protein
MKEEGRRKKEEGRRKKEEGGILSGPLPALFFLPAFWRGPCDCPTGFLPV